MQSPTPAPPRPRSWWPDAVLLAAFAALTAILASGGLLGVDIAVRDWSDAHRPQWMYWPAWVLNFLGQGGPLTAVAGLLGIFHAWRNRSWRPLVAPVAALLAVAGSVGALKLWTHRGFPHYGSVEFFSEVDQYAFPSGHVVNTLVWYAVLIPLLWPRIPDRVRYAVRVIPVVAVFCTTVYLGFHWFTDSVAAVLLGLPLARFVERVRAWTAGSRIG